jgi:hypothetical protein
MKVMSTWTLKPGAFHEAVRRFVAGEGAPAEGTTLLGRWHSADLSCGYSLFETSDSAALYAGSAKWADVLDLKHVLVIEDDQAGPVLASLNKR